MIENTVIDNGPSAEKKKTVLNENWMLCTDVSRCLYAKIILVNTYTKHIRRTNLVSFESVTMEDTLQLSHRSKITTENESWNKIVFWLTKKKIEIIAVLFTHFSLFQWFSDGTWVHYFYSGAIISVAKLPQVIVSYWKSWLAVLCSIREQIQVVINKVWVFNSKTDEKCLIIQNDQPLCISLNLLRLTQN